ncbi:hypothetical protein AMTRI_Chr02g219690 [Amborella trichopoda]
MLCGNKFGFGLNIFIPITLDFMTVEKDFKFRLFGFYYNPVSTTFYMLASSLFWMLYSSTPGKWMEVRSPSRRRWPLNVFRNILTCVLRKFYNVFYAGESGGYSIEVFDTAREEWEESLPLPTGLPRPDYSDFGFKFLEWDGHICFVRGWFHEGSRKECRMGIWVLRPRKEDGIK